MKAPATERHGEPCHLPAGALPPGVVETGRVASYAGAGGQVLRYRVLAAPRPRHHLLYLHGIESHSGWFLAAAEQLRARGCTVWLLDRRGSGLNRATGVGDAPSARTLLADVQAFRAHIGDPPLHLVGLSWGGKLATAAALEQPRQVQGVVLVTPGLRARVDLRLAQKVAVVLDRLRGGDRRFALPIAPEMFTRTPPLLEFIRHDPWRVTAVTARLLFASRCLDLRIARRIARLTPPVLLLLAGHEEIIDNDGVLRLLARRRAGPPEVRHYPQATHSIQLEQVDEMVADIHRFLEAHSLPC
jgi:alpha-beta hydrolase superfamily lysophospholipase